jgi:capsule polysaccharide export protein KpsC/LpsZ
MKFPQTNNKTILFFSIQGLSPLHLGFELEIIEELLKGNNTIYTIKCDNQLSTCFFNPTHNLFACAICETRTIKFHNQFKQLNRLTLENKNVTYKSPKINSLEELINLNYNDINIGRGVASSIISLYREYNINKIDNIDEIINENCKMAINTILNFENFISEYSPDEVYLFNGRFTEVYAISELCKKFNLTYKTFETGASRNKYSIRTNTTVHNIKGFQDDMKIFAERLDKKVVIEEGKKIYNDRIKGNQGEVYNFLTLQEKRKLPSNFNNNKNNIVIFNSSEDEMKVIKDWKIDLYENQNTAIKTIINHFKDNDNFHFYLRNHPNLINIINSQTTELAELDFKNLTVINSDDPIDTYALIESCDKTISFGSSTGIEASFLGKPSILLGNSFYKGLNCVYEPNSFEELFTLINNRDLYQKKDFNIFLYIYTAYHKGIEVKNFHYEGLMKSSYKRVRIKRIYLKTVIQFFLFINNMKHWKKMTNLILKEKLSIKNMFILKSHSIDKTHHKG